MEICEGYVGRDFNYEKADAQQKLKKKLTHNAN